MTHTERRIGRHHIAFYRGWLQGIDLRALADRYLETGLDIRIAKSTLAWLRDTLSRAALRHGRRRESRLLRLHLAAAASTPLPSLEEFRAERDPSGFYSEKELVQLYLEAFPQARDERARRRKRLLDEQLAALAWIEELLATDPVPDDPVAAWLEPQVADRLARAGIATIGALIERIRLRGYRWWASVPKLGEKGALRIVAWLDGYQRSLGELPEYARTPARAQPARALVQARSRETAIVPIEAFAVPEELSGAHASNRHPQPPRIEATNDYQAVHAWLATKAASPHTLRAYRKEAERLMLWAIIERGKPLSSLSVEDCAAYRDWLAMLGRTPEAEWTFRVPQSRWIGPRNIPRHSPAWRPFDGPLSSASIRQALAIVSAMFAWLVRVHYCAFNPWEAVGRKLAPTPEAPPEIELARVFSRAQWQYLTEYVARQPTDAYHGRLRFVLAFAYATGMRLSELVSARVGHLYAMPLRDRLGVRWMLKVQGKGGRWRAVPLPGHVIDALGQYLTERGLDPDPLANPADTPVLASLSGNRPVSASALYKTLHETFRRAAAALRASGRHQEAKDFDRASVHWLRHSRASHLASDGVPVNLIQKLLGHASLATTSIYTESDDERLWIEIERHDGESFAPAE